MGNFEDESMPRTPGSCFLLCRSTMTSLTLAEWKLVRLGFQSSSGLFSETKGQDAGVNQDRVLRFS